MNSSFIETFELYSEHYNVRDSSFLAIILHILVSHDQDNAKNQHCPDNYEDKFNCIK